MSYTHNLGNYKAYQNKNGDIPGDERDWFRSKGSPGEPGVSYHGPITRTTPFASILWELGSLVTNFSRGLWADIDR